MSDFERQLDSVLATLRETLIEKNSRYDNSALEPIQVFSKLSAMERINVSIDYKLSRIKNAKDDEPEDAKLDLIGYLILEWILRLNTNIYEVKE